MIIILIMVKVVTLNLCGIVSPYKYKDLTGDNGSEL